LLLLCAKLIIVSAYKLSDEEIKKLIAILRFSKDACPIESLPEKIESDEVDNLVSKFEKAIE
jgi:hypothetical protein